MIIGIAAFAIMLIFTYEEPTLLEKRFAKTSHKKESPITNLLISLQELLTPFAKKNAKNQNYMSKSKKLLLQAGYASSEDDVIKYDSQKVASALIAAAFCGLLLLIDFSTSTLICSILIIFLVYRLPEMRLEKEIKLRKKEFMKHLPDAIDMLSICVQAGLGLDAAFEKVSDEFKLTSNTVSEEFGRLNKDILSGLNREDAYKNMILRNENQDLQSFIALLVQSDRLGTSITQSLDAFCDSMRTKKRQRIEELSQQAATKMTVPMVLFMLPAIFIIIMYPAIQKIMQNLGGH